MDWKWTRQEMLDESEIESTDHEWNLIKDKVDSMEQDFFSELEEYIYKTLMAFSWGDDKVDDDKGKGEQDEGDKGKGEQDDDDKVIIIVL